MCEAMTEALLAWRGDAAVQSVLIDHAGRRIPTALGDETERISGAQVLPLSGSGLSADDLFGAPPMTALLDDLRQAFDLIVIDTAPVLVLADARILSAKADTVILLARWRKTPARAVAAAIRPRPRHRRDR